MKPLNLPTDYHPFKTIRIGENYFENAQALVTIGGHAPLLIGKGVVPRVWLSVLGKQPGGDWLELIVDNLSHSSALTVDSRKILLKVDKDEAMVCRATSTVNDDLIINGLDLRPFDLEIYSDAQVLHIMGSTMTSNVISGVPVVMVVP